MREHFLKATDFWCNVIFCNESKLNVLGSNMRCMVWRNKNVGDLVFIDGQTNEEYYLNILKGSLHQSAGKIDIVNQFKFYQDNDSKHMATIVHEWLLYHYLKVMHPPAQSPNLNPIENCCEELDRRKHRRSVSLCEELKKRL